MFISKKEYDKLKEHVQRQDEIIRDLYEAVTQLGYELNELKKPKEPTYFQ